jgi:hypothetical protein
MISSLSPITAAGMTDSAPSGSEAAARGHASQAAARQACQAQEPSLERLAKVLTIRDILAECVCRRRIQGAAARSIVIGATASTVIFDTDGRVFPSLPSLPRLSAAL